MRTRPLLWIARMGGWLLLAIAASSQVRPEMKIPEESIRRATEVKDRRIDFLFGLPAVTGAGVGASSENPGTAAIHVYVTRRLNEKERAQFPKELDGVPVEVLESGPIVALADRAVAFSMLPLESRKGVAEPAAHVISSHEEWRRFLAETLGYSGAPPAVDFRSETVVAIFAGQKPTGGYSVRVEKVTEESRPGQPSRATIHHRVIAPPAEAIVTQALTYPYIIIRVVRKLDSIDFRPPIEAHMR